LWDIQTSVGNFYGGRAKGILSQDGEECRGPGMLLEISFESTIEIQHPHPFDFAQGRLSRKKREKDGAPGIQLKNHFTTETLRHGEGGFRFSRGR
jgi:hypothetical protein